MDEDWKKAWGIFAGSIGGSATGAKIGLGLSPVVALVPGIGPLLAFLVVIGSPIAGMICGARFGEKHPGMASMSAAVGVLGVPGLDLGAEGATETLSS